MHGTKREAEDVPPELRERDIVPPEPERLVAFQAQVQAEDPELGMFIWLAAVSGARRGELCARHGRAAHGSQPAVRGAGGAVGVRLAADAHVFARDPQGLEPWRPDSMTHRFVDARRKAGLGDGVCLHDMRHFLATSFATGVDVRTVSGRLGHRRTSTMTDRCAAFVPASDRLAADGFEASLRPKPDTRRGVMAQRRWRDYRNCRWTASLRRPRRPHRRRSASPSGGSPTGGGASSG